MDSTGEFPQGKQKQPHRVRGQSPFSVIDAQIQKSHDRSIVRWFLVAGSGGGIGALLILALFEQL